MPDSGFQFFTKPQYFADLIKRLTEAKPGERFITANMVTEPEYPDVAKVVQAMVAAARRGVKVALITDAYNFLRGSRTPGSLILHRHLPHIMSDRHQILRKALEDLRAAGGRYVVTNQPSRLFSNTFAGRSHIKFTVSGNRYYVGGCNLERLSNLDMMVGATDSRVADWLSDLGERMLASGQAMEAIGRNDVTLATGPGETFYIDSGMRGRSLILDEALEFIDAAKEHIFFAGQYYPNDITGRHLKAAYRRGVRVEIAYNHFTKYHRAGQLLHLGVVLAERLQSPSSFFEHAFRHSSGYLHAKLIATEQGAIIGSHNFISAGVRLGTAELALRVLDPEFARRATETVMKQLPEVRMHGL